MVGLRRKLMPGVLLNRQGHIAACLFCRRPLVPTIGSQTARIFQGMEQAFYRA